MFRRHPVLTLFGLLATLLLLSCAVFLATFDLNRYREDLQDSLSTALHRPVRLGEAKLSWHLGPAFNFTQLEISGNQGEPALLKVDQLYLKPQVLPMLTGRLAFSEVVLDTPRLSLRITAESPPAPDVFHTTLTTVRVDSVTVRNGSLEIIDQSRPGPAFQIDLDQLQVKARHLFAENRGRLRLEAQLAQAGGYAQLNLAGKLTLPPTPKQWSRARCDLELTLQGLTPGPLSARYGTHLGLTGADGLLDGQLTLAGSPTEGLEFAAEMKGSDLQLQLPDYYSAPLSLNQVNCSGRWTADKTVHSLADLTLTADALTLEGHLTIQRVTDDPWLEGGIHSPKLALEEIWRLLPDKLPAFSEREWSSRFPNGKVQIALARFAGPLDDFRRPGRALPLQEAKLHLRDFQVDIGLREPVSQLGLDLTLTNGKLNLSEGRAMLLGSPLHFSGRLEKPFSAEIKTQLGVAWILPTGKMAALFPKGGKGLLTGDGPIPLSLTISGEGRKFEASLRGDLDACMLDLHPLFHKETGIPGRLEIKAGLTPDRLLLHSGALELGPVGLTFSGARSLTAEDILLPVAEQPFQLRLNLTGTDLADTGNILPPLDEYRLRGRLTGNYLLRGKGFAIGQADGSLAIDKLGVHFPGVLKGDLHGFSGRAKIFRDRVVWRGLKGFLGENPVRISGQVGNWSAPQTELTFNAGRIKASDLFFPSPQAELKNLQGRLVFRPKEILFDGIRVSLGNEPALTVNGRLRNRERLLTLDIAGERADIDRVVALWEGPGKDTHPPPRGEELKVVVKGRLGKGTYGPLKFSNAVGTVTATAGALHIDPVRFALDRGSCNARISLLRENGRKHLLKISGRVENASAETLHRLAFPDRKSLLSGTVSGDFTLQGRAGRDFLTTSGGGFDLRVTEGVLYRFAFLSKVFSLLNVGQLLTFNLPDMAREGMPFEKLAGRFSLEGGKLTTQDLFLTSNAMNMSMVGTVDLVNRELNLKVGVKPFRTVDTILTHIPIAGWLLTGDEKALITAHFEITGKSDDPQVRAIPVTSLSSQVLGIFKRVLGLPGKAITDPAGLITGQKKEAEETP